MGKLQAIEQASFGGVDSFSNPITLPPDKFLLLRNWKPRADGHLELREGYAQQPAGAGYAGSGPIHSMSPYTVAYPSSNPFAPFGGPNGLPFPNGSECVFFWIGLVPYVRWMDGDTYPTAQPTIRGNAIASPARWQYAVGKDGYLYMHNGTDMKFFDGVYLRDIGLPIISEGQVGGISVAEDLSAPVINDIDNVSFDFVASSAPGSTQANAISGFMYLAWFDPSNDVLVGSTEPLNGAAFPSGHSPAAIAAGGYDSVFLRVNNLPPPSKPGAVTLLFYPGGSAAPALQPGAVCKFYPHDAGGATYNSQFEYSNALDTYGGGIALPGAPSDTFTLNDDESLLFNPFRSDFPGWTLNNGTIWPMEVAGVNAGGSWNGHHRVISTFAVEGPPGWVMTVEGKISFPAAGEYTFTFEHDDGALMGFEIAVTPISGYIDPALQTLTADKGYPVCSNKATAGQTYNTFVVSVAAAGIYSFEIDYCNWKFSQTCCLYNGSVGSLSAIMPGVTGDASTLDPSYITTPTGPSGNGQDSATLTMVSATQVNVHLTAHGFLGTEVIVLSLHKSSVYDIPQGANYTTPFTPVLWTKNGPFTITLVDPDNFTFNTPEAALMDGATPITIQEVLKVTGATQIIDTDNLGWPTRSRNGFEKNQSGQILLPGPLDGIFETGGLGNLIPASAIGGAQPGYQFYASIYNPLTGHVGNRVAIGPRIRNETDTTFLISGLPDLSAEFWGNQALQWGNRTEPEPAVSGVLPPKQKQGQLLGLTLSPGDSEWCLLIGRTGDGGEVPYAIIDSAGNWIYAKAGAGQATIEIDYGSIDGNSELPFANYIPPPFVVFWREGDRLCGAIDKQPFVYRSSSELDATTGIFVGDPAQAWDPSKTETFPTAQAIFGGFGFMQESWVFTKGHVAQLSELSGEVVWNGPYNFGIIGPHAFDYGWNGLPFWVSKDRQLCTMTPEGNGPIVISTQYEATLLQSIGNLQTDPTDKNNHATATGTGTPQTSATLTPGNPNTLAFFVSNAGSSTPTGWNAPAGGSLTFTKLLSSTAPIFVTNPSTGVGAPSNEWANIIAIIATGGGTPAVVQHVTTNATAYTHSMVLPSNVTAGNCIVVGFSGNSPNPATGTPSVTDSQGNTYVVINANNTNSGYHVEAFLAIALGCKAGPTTVTIGTTLEQGNWDVFEYSGILASLNVIRNYASETELVYFRDPLRMIEVLRIKCLDSDGVPFVVIHDFNLRVYMNPYTQTALNQGAYGQAYEEDYESTLSSDFTSIRILNELGRSLMWAGGVDGRFYQFYSGGDDNGVNFTGDAISLRYVSGERTAVKTLEWYGDDQIEWYTNEQLTATADDPDSWVDLSDQARPFPGDEGNSHYQTDMMSPEVIHLFLWARLVSHPADALDPTNPMALSVPPHLPVEMYGRLYLAAPLIGDTRGR